MELEIKHKAKGNKIKVSYSEVENLIDMIETIISLSGANMQIIRASENNEAKNLPTP